MGQSNPSNVFYLKYAAGLTGKGNLPAKFLPPGREYYAGLTLKYKVNQSGKARTCHYVLFRWIHDGDETENWVALMVKQYPDEQARPKQTWKLKLTTLPNWYWGVYKERMSANIDKTQIASITVTDLIIHRPTPPEVEDHIQAMRFCEHLDKG